MNSKIKFIRLCKGLFFVLRIDKLIPRKTFHFLANSADLSKFIAVHKKNCRNDFFSHKFDYQKREELYEYIVKNQNLEEESINYLEFGVAKGLSFKWWIDRIKNEDSRFYGFDTFTGLPEDWGHFKKGDMSTSNKLPEIADRRHVFYTGLFQQTLIPFLKTYNSSARKIIHMDADIYSSTLYVLTLLTPYLNSGDILFFDEFNVPLHEFKAFKEWSESFYIKYKVLGAVNNFYQVAILID